MKKKLLNRDNIFVIFVLLATAILLFIPTGFEKIIYPNTERAKALIVDTDNLNIKSAGLIKHGDQLCKMKILSGKFKGQSAEGVNRLVGKLEMDKIFNKGDTALVVIDYTDDEIRFVNIIDHYRLSIEIILFLAFILLLVIFAGWTGVKALLSFVFTILMIWKILIPFFLKGYNPIILSLLVVSAMTVGTICLVSGISRKSLAAILGSLSGSLLTCILAITFGNGFKIHGAVLPFSESLLYSGYMHLNLTDIFIAGIFIASAGALMDLAMDISAAIYEIVQKKPDISKKEAILSGFSIGRAVIGTMTTTLLLAYSGGFVALLMVFMAQGTPIQNILNLKYVSAEILHTIVGSFGLVTVAPITAVLSGILMASPELAGKLKEQASSPSYTEEAP
ncbi:putative membrane protein [Anaerobacterium chartisolvens]|uniref:Putative membrane protein n=1 Tax=Anaerobacterium chartisolvens TaxID=1297424 RepID=A0A369B6I1_9FIRM|nr:YibE/F family protein [Anaerobacterium chartisolvens]RCX17132.1 putative membrane protein [Anaerobacterium chartisolvens]